MMVGGEVVEGKGAPASVGGGGGDDGDKKPLI